MSSWILAQQLVITLIILLLLLSKNKTLPLVGAKLSYRLWLLVPLSVLISNFPASFTPLGNNQITHYIIELNQQTTQIAQLTLWQMVWLSGVLAMLIGCWRSQHYRKIVSSLVMIDRGQLPLTLPDNLHAYISNNVTSPLLAGIITPKLILPVNYRSIYTVCQLKLIIEHELCHLRRQDNLINLLAIAALCLCWFNQFAWLGYRSFRRQQEIACDDYVLNNKNQQQRIEYSKALVTCAQQQQHSQQLCIYSNYGEKNTMFKRINLLKQGSKAKRSYQAIALIAACGMLSTIATAHQTPKEHKATTQGEIRPIVRIEPKYPIEAARSRTEGSVVLKFDISTAGKVTNVNVVNSKPQGVFDKEAKFALEKWTYGKNASGAVNQLVQLDFVMDKKSSMPNLIERIKVTN